MLQGKMDSYLGYEKGSKEGFNTDNSRNGSYPKTIQGRYGEAVVEVPHRPSPILPTKSAFRLLNGRTVL